MTQARGASALTWIDNNGSGILTKSDLKKPGIVERKGELLKPLKEVIDEVETNSSAFY